MEELGVFRIGRGDFQMSIFVQDDSSGVRTLHFKDQASLNALSPDDGDQFLEIVNRLKKEIGYAAKKTSSVSSKTWALVLLAEGVKTSKQTVSLSGGHLNLLAGLSKKRLWNFFYRITLANLTLRSLPIPSFFFASGDLIGGGAEIFLACDFGFLLDSAGLHFRQIENGLCTGFGGSLFLNEKMGYSKQNLLFRESKITAMRGKNLGLVTDVFSNGSDISALINSELNPFRKLHSESYAVQKKLLLPTIYSSPKKLQTYAEYQASEICKLWGNPLHQNFLSKFFESRK